MEAKLAAHKEATPPEETYSNFIKLFKWGSVAVAISTAIIVFIIAGRAA